MVQARARRSAPTIPAYARAIKHAYDFGKRSENQALTQTAKPLRVSDGKLANISGGCEVGAKAGRVGDCVAGVCTRAVKKALHNMKRAPKAC
jgi:hypothetical protein